MECCCYLQHIQDLLSGGKTPHERCFGEPSKGQIIPFGSLFEGLDIKSGCVRTWQRLSENNLFQYLSHPLLKLQAHPV